jgi:hypothetical protein
VIEDVLAFFGFDIAYARTEITTNITVGTTKKVTTVSRTEIPGNSTIGPSLLFIGKV